MTDASLSTPSLSAEWVVDRCDTRNCSKKDSKHAQIVDNLSFSLKAVQDDGVSLPASLASRSSEMLKLAGIEL